MSRRALPVSGTGITSRWVAGGTALAAALTVAGAVTLPARSAPDSQCPAAFPVADLAAGQAVSGLTVSSGTTPEGFTGSVLGVLHDGIAPGLDMIMVRLTSPELERVGGIWAGMSGSPVYAADGRLIGAVSYGLTAGPSTVAGLTPAADMQEMLTGSGEALPGASTGVEIPDGMAARMVRNGAASNAEVDEGMSQLRLPVGVSGLANRKRLRQFAKRIEIDNARLMRAGTSSSVAGPSTLVPGGNMVSSISYGDVSFSAIGTATAVCGSQVLGFGHPMLWTGPTTLTLHGAEAIYVQEDPTFAGFKVANVGPPVGTVNQDRLPGIVGVEGALPATSDISSTVTLGSRSRDGETHVSLPEWVPDIAFGHLLSNQDRIFDGIGKGGARLDYTIQGAREDGTGFTLRRNDLFADPFDITFASTVDVADSLFQLEFNGIEDIRIDDVHVSSALTRHYDHYVLEQVQVRVAGRWTRLDENRTLRLRAGMIKRFRVLLDSADSGPRRVLLEVPVPARTAGRTGLLEVFGGNGFFGGEGFFEGGPTSAEDEPTFDDILRTLRRQPANNDVVADLSFFNRRGDATDQVRDRVATELVVDGGIAVQVRSVR